jgi:hypothetical protein
VWIRKARESNFVQLMEPVHGTFRSLTLGSDGFVYYHLIDPIRTAAGLHRVSIETGSIEKISDTAAAGAFSPDGSKLAYVSTTSMGLHESMSSFAMRTLRIRERSRFDERPRPS